MKKIVNIIIYSFFLNHFIFCSSFAKSESTYKNFYPYEFNYSLNFYRDNYYILNNIINNSYSYNTKFLYSIVAPEVGNYSSIKDKFETNTLELFYVKFGSEYADFSIGFFQMKPSFIERLETEIKSKKIKEFYSLCMFNSKMDLEIRKERIERLKSLVWQAKYLSAFYNIVNRKFKEKIFNNENEKIKFYATIYNLGIDADINKIEKWKKIANFPRDIIIEKKQFIYCEVANEYFNNIK